MKKNKKKTDNNSWHRHQVQSSINSQAENRTLHSMPGWNRSAQQPLPRLLYKNLSKISLFRVEWIETCDKILPKIIQNALKTYFQRDEPPPPAPPAPSPQWTMCFFLCLRTFRYSHLVPKNFFLWHKFHRSTCTDEHKRSSVWAPDWGATCVRAAGPPCQAFLMWAPSGAKLNDICVPFCSHSRSRSPPWFTGMLMSLDWSHRWREDAVTTCVFLSATYRPAGVTQSCWRQNFSHQK